MSEKIRDFFELVHSMNHGDLRQIARAITAQIADTQGAQEFDSSDYRDVCDVLFDCASRAVNGDMDADMGTLEAEPADELPGSRFAEPEPDTGPVSAFARKGA